MSFIAIEIKSFRKMSLGSSRRQACTNIRPAKKLKAARDRKKKKKKTAIHFEAKLNAPVMFAWASVFWFRCRYINDRHRLRHTQPYGPKILQIPFKVKSWATCCADGCYQITTASKYVTRLKWETNGHMWPRLISFILCSAPCFHFSFIPFFLSFRFLFDFGSGDVTNRSLSHAIPLCSPVCDLWVFFLLAETNIKPWTEHRAVCCGYHLCTDGMRYARKQFFSLSLFWCVACDEWNGSSCFGSGKSNRSFDWVNSHSRWLSIEWWF